MGISQEEFFGGEQSLTKNVSQEEFFGGGGMSVAKPESEEEKLNFAERFGKDIEKRSAMAQQIIEATQNGEQSTAEGYMQVAGKVGAGAILDFIGEVLISGGRGLSNITPDVIERPLIDGAISAGYMLLNTDAGQAGLNAAKEGIESWKEFKKENPRSARNIEAVVDIALIAVPVKGKPKSNLTAVGRASESLSKKAVQQTTKSKKEFVDDLITPKQTKAVREEQVARTTEEGILTSKKVELSPKEIKIAEEVNKLAVSGENTLQGNWSIINKAVVKEAVKLKSTLKENNVFFQRKEYLAVLNKAKKEMAESPVLVGDAASAATKMMTKLGKLVKSNESSAAGLLKVRKEFDQWIKSYKPKAFDPKQENAMTEALKVIRQKTNDFIATKATNVGVKKSLAKQSNLYRALENIGPKAADEANNMLLRAWHNFQKVLPLRGEFNQSMAAMWGIGGLGASALFAPIFTKAVFAGIGIYATGKLIMSAQTKRTLASMLKKSDQAIRATKDANLLKELRVDRAFILEIIKTGEERQLSAVDQELKELLSL